MCYQQIMKRVAGNTLNRSYNNNYSQWQRNSTAKEMNFINNNRERQREVEGKREEAFEQLCVAVEAN